MTHSPVHSPARILSLCLALLVTMVVGEAFAGEARGAAGIPPRSTKIKKGDWVLYKEEGGFRKETATDSEKTEDDYIVYYSIEEYDEKGKVKQEMDQVARFQSDEAKENADFIASVKGAKVERRKVQIDGKNTNVLVYIVADPSDNSRTEYWYSDDFTIDGRVAMIVYLSDEDAYKAFETVGFGDAKTRFNLKKYLD